MINDMERRFIKTLPYDDVDFRFISNHYDVHLSGTCLLDGKLHEFKNDYPEEDEEMMVRIYKLDLLSKFKWYWTQWKFENCVGYHWSYINNKRGKSFYYRNPKWLYTIIFNLYFNKSK